MMATCRDCAHYDIEAHRLPSGKMRVTNKTALCQFDMSRLIRKFPASVAPHDRAVKPHWMAPTDGNGCPQWTARRLAAIDAVLAKVMGE